MAAATIAVAQTTAAEIPNWTGVSRCPGSLMERASCTPGLRMASPINGTYKNGAKASTTHRRWLRQVWRCCPTQRARVVRKHNAEPGGHRNNTDRQKGDERTGPHDLTPGIVAQADIHHPSRARDPDQRVTGDDPYDVDRDGDGGGCDP